MAFLELLEGGTMCGTSIPSLKPRAPLRSSIAFFSFRELLRSHHFDSAEYALLSVQIETAPQLSGLTYRGPRFVQPKDQDHPFTSW